MPRALRAFAPTALDLMPHAPWALLPDDPDGGATGGAGGATGGSGTSSGTSGSGSSDGPDTGAQGRSGGSSGDGDLGYPKDTKVEDMTVDQQAAYWKHQARKHESTAKSRGDYSTIKKQLEELQRSAMSDQERAVAAARDEGRAEGRQAAAPRLVAAEFRAAAAGREVNGKPINVADLLEGIDPTRYLTAEGDVDADKVARYLDAIAPKATGSTGRAFPDLGQGRREESPRSGKEAGLAEAARRFGKRTTS